eukprot:610600-Pyramimonas_sp.AAC.1
MASTGGGLVTVLIAVLLSSAQCAPLPECANGMQWAQSVAISLANEGCPIKVQTADDSHIMLHAIVDRTNRMLDIIPREAHFVEMFSGAAGTSRMVASHSRARVYTFDRVDSPGQDA